MGGRGRNEASSSASRAFEREPHIEAAMPLERLLLSASEAYVLSTLLSEMGFETGRGRRTCPFSSTVTSLELGARAGGMDAWSSLRLILPAE